MMIVGWDLAPRKCGWCAGDGSRLPEAGGERLPGLIDDYGEALDALAAVVDRVHERFDPDVVFFESPIMPRRKGAAVMGTLAQRRMQYAQAAFLEWLVRRRAKRLGKPIICREVENGDAKYALTGDRHASKEMMVEAAERIGILLPALLVNGREDAADGCGVWLVGVSYHAKQHLPRWDQAVFGRRGLL